MACRRLRLSLADLECAQLNFQRLVESKSGHLPEATGADHYNVDLLIR